MIRGKGHVEAVELSAGVAALRRFRAPRPLSKLLRPLASPLLIVVIAFGLRLGALSYRHTYVLPAEFHSQFGWEVGKVARAIASGQGFGSPYDPNVGLTAQQPPIYPYLVAGVFKLFGIFSARSAFVIMAINSLFSALICIPIFFIGRKVFGAAVGVVSAWAWCFYPFAVFYPIERIWDESLAALLLGLIFWMTLRLEDATRTGRWVGYGALWGFAALADPALLSVLPFLLAWLGYRRRKQSLKSVLPLGVTLAVFLLGISPWLVRNYLVFGRFVFIRDDLGAVLHMGNHLGATTSDSMRFYPAGNPSEMAEYRRLGEVAYMAEKKREAIHFIARHPRDFLRLTLERMTHFWVWRADYRPFLRTLGPVLPPLVFALLPILAVTGLILMFRERKPEIAPFAVLFVVFPFIYEITLFYPRFRHPIEPELVVLAVYSLAGIERLLAGETGGSKA